MVYSAGLVPINLSKLGAWIFHSHPKFAGKESGLASAMLRSWQRRTVLLTR